MEDFSIFLMLVGNERREDREGRERETREGREEERKEGGGREEGWREEEREEVFIQSPLLLSSPHRRIQSSPAGMEYEAVVGAL